MGGGIDQAFPMDVQVDADKEPERIREKKPLYYFGYTMPDILQKICAQITKQENKSQNTPSDSRSVEGVLAIPTICVHIHIKIFIFRIFCPRKNRTMRFTIVHNHKGR